MQIHETTIRKRFWRIDSKNVFLKELLKIFYSSFDIPNLLLFMNDNRDKKAF